MNSKEEYQVANYIVAYKLALGVLEVVFGLGIAIWGRPIVVMYQQFRAQELFEDPHDILVRVLETVVPYLFAHKGYVIAVLILLGVVKIIGAIGLMYRKWWGLDLLVGLTLILLPFQFFSLIRHPSWLSLAYVIVGLLIVLFLTNFNPGDYVKKLKVRAAKRNGSGT